MVVERKLRRDRSPRIRGVLLVYPLLQLAHFRLPSYRTYVPYHLLSLLREETLTQTVNFYMNTSFTEDELFNNRHLSFDDYEKFYSRVNLTVPEEYRLASSFTSVPHPDTAKLFDEAVSPLLATDEILLESPSTLIVACTYDVLQSDAQLYYHRLANLRVKDVLYKEYRIFHGAMTFVDFPVAFTEAFQIIYDTAQFVVNRTLSL